MLGYTKLRGTYASNEALLERYTPEHAQSWPNRVAHSVVDLCSDFYSAGVDDFKTSMGKAVALLIQCTPAALKTATVTQIVQAVECVAEVWHCTLGLWAGAKLTRRVKAIFETWLEVDSALAYWSNFYSRSDHGGAWALFCEVVMPIISRWARGLWAHLTSGGDSPGALEDALDPKTLRAEDDGYVIYRQNATKIKSGDVPGLKGGAGGATGGGGGGGRGGGGKKGGGGGNGAGGANKTGPCDHCGNKSHHVDSCWSLHPHLAAARKAELKRKRSEQKRARQAAAAKEQPPASPGPTVNWQWGAF
eukprot:SAG11_NODE_1976_length_3974_cov_4.102452_2_plen_305_part_00